MRRPSAGSIAVILVLAGASAGCSDGGTGPIRAARVAITAERTTLVRTQELQLGVTVYDANDNPLQGRRIDWASSAGHILSVSPTGLLRAHAAGTARISATCEGQRAEILFVVNEAYAVRASGALHRLAQSTAEPMRVSLRDVTGTEASVLVGGDGTFSVAGETASESFDIVASGESAMHLPALVRRPSSQASTEMRFVMTPARWTPSVGSYTATTTNIDPAGAFAPPCTTIGDTNCDGFYPRAWLGGIKLWGDDLLPASLAFDRGRSTSPISAEDSTAFWAIVRQMEADLGRALFVPATFADLSVATDGWSSGAVLVRIDGTLGPYRGYANWRWDGQGTVYAGVVRLGSAQALRHSGLVTHELLHTIGFKHSCSWTTVMGGYGCPLFDRLSTTDVAHAQLAFAMRAAQRQHSALHGLVAALDAQRVLIHGQPPVASSAPRGGARLLRLPGLGGEDGAW